MTDKNGAGSPPSPRAVKIIRAGFRAKKNDFQIQRQVRIEIGESVKRTAIAGLRHGGKEISPQAVNAKRFLKKTGADIVREFLEGIREGEDVSTLQAVLEHAVYIDCLRRYASRKNGVALLDVKEIIKITNDYRKLHISSARAGVAGSARGKVSARFVMELLEIVEAGLADSPSLTAHFRDRKPALIDRLKSLLGRDEEPEIELLQKLNEKNPARGKGLSDD